MWGLLPRRSLRPFIAFCGVAFIIYIPLTITSSRRSPIPEETPRNKVDNEIKDKKMNNLDAKVSDIRAGDQPGKVDLVLSIDAKDLLRIMGDVTFPESVGTVNPLPLNVSVVMHDPDLCKGKELKWIVYVHSAPGNSRRRMNVRRTWANVNMFKNHLFEVVFMLGKTNDVVIQKDIQEEFNQYGDLVQGDFLDEYKNITLKGIMALKWVSTYCSNAPIAIKADDDAFVNIFEIMKLITRYNDNKNLVMCPLWKDNSMPILRDPSKCMKWCVKDTEFPGKRYFPKYCAGLSYIISQNMAKEMYQASLTTPFFWIDDVYITGLLPKKVKSVSYADLLRNFTLKEAVAMEMYSNISQKVTLYFIHIKKEENFDIFWKYSLMRLTTSELKFLTVEVLDQFPDLKLRDQLLATTEAAPKL